jgi:NAD(P)H-dependent flavin oxidoreductase YrpB (nitropropane dioxygenase family)
MTRSRRNKFIERWAGREWALRQHQAEAIAKLRAAREMGDVDEGPLSMGQDAGLIHDIPGAEEIVVRIAREAEEILMRKLPALIRARDL